ncbi:fasciclin domain-containing protein [Nodosilinea sp. LEGE 07088]|uniref:fasciclin domain-containing protein n=1 Tax=Nodosilinea sp. LEGE 07088 TaxID=2777968 RepID=UPI001882EB51|nr:fasciclin domain-containing protein [Nodosilinea sp. LEGE 07088]MBE9140933.1 fasciclin domain-containing protein [Nodosilinea sp. LEGE 07088]
MIARFSLIKLLAIAGVFGLGVAPAVVAQVEEPTPAVKQAGEAVMPNADIATIVSGVEGFSTLEAALGAAGLTEALAGEGPFTVIAPTNDAFAALPDGVVEALLLPENKDLLTEVLTYHVIPGEVPYASLAPGMVTTLSGEELTVTIEGAAAFVDGIEIVGSDIPATNGLIHVVEDSVLVPADVATELGARLAAAEEEETMVEETMVEETLVEEAVVEEAAPAAPVRGLW